MGVIFFFFFFLDVVLVVGEMLFLFAGAGWLVVVVVVGCRRGIQVSSILHTCTCSSYLVICLYDLKGRRMRSQEISRTSHLRHKYSGIPCCK